MSGVSNVIRTRQYQLYNDPTKMYIPPNTRRPKCCRKKAYNSDDSICCDDKNVVPKSSSGADKCCGVSTYDPKTVSISSCHKEYLIDYM